MRALSVGLALALCAPVAAAQHAAGDMPDAYRDVQVRMLELQRRMLLSMADSMPESLYTDKVTDVQRDFAHQLHHAASAVVMIGTRFAGASNAGAPAEATNTTFTTKAGMKAYINGVYDWAAKAVQAQSADSRGEMTNLFGTAMPRWQVWDEIHQHTIWTAGQVVANFRKHGMAPPGFGFF